MERPTLTNLANFVIVLGPDRNESTIELIPRIDKKELAMAGTERQRELRKRRHRTKKLANLHKKCEKANKTEKAAIVHKLRRLSPGAEQLIAAWKLS